MVNVPTGCYSATALVQLFSSDKLYMDLYAFTFQASKPKKAEEASFTEMKMFSHVVCNSLYITR
jgi:hypothetical protein